MTERVYDLIIIGGGVSGIGLAKFMSNRDLDILLIDKSTLLKGASANSLRIIHGGFRYLQTLSFQRVVESIKAQDELLKQYPQYIQELNCILPLQKYGLKSSLPVSIASHLYSGIHYCLTGRKAGNKVVTKGFIDQEAASVSRLCEHGALVWTDAQIVDLEGFHQKLMDEVSASSVEIQAHCIVRSIEQEKDLLLLNAEQHGEIVEYRSKYVVNCGGAWLDQIEVKLQDFARPQHQWCKAFNLILKRKIFDKYALALESKSDASKRSYFITTRGDHSVIGTEYVACTSSPDDLRVSDEEKTEFINNANYAFPELKLQKEDVVGEEVGVLPFKKKTGSNFQLLGQEEIYAHGQYIEVLSTKYTTFLQQAKTIAKKLEKLK